MTEPLMLNLDLPDTPPVEPVRYQMQSWDDTPTGRAWVPMENGAARSRWMPKRDARDAVRQCAQWAGAIYGLGIPAMQVVELPSGTVIWRDSSSYPDAGPPIAPDWQTDVYEAARADLAKDPDPDPDPDPADEQGDLFDDH